MHPFLFDWTVWGIPLRPPTYGVLLATAFTVAYFLALYRAAKLKEEPRHIENLFLVVVIASILGSRLFHVLFEEPTYYFTHPVKILAVWEGGYTLYGAMIASILGLIGYCRLKSISILQFADISAPATAMGIAIGRVGCFFAGCCWGKPTTSLFGVTFNHPETFSGLKGIAVHPTQLYEAAGACVIFFYLNHKFKTRRYRGQILFHGLIAYAVLRFLIEFFRGDDYRGFVLGGSLSYSQLISILLFIIAVVGMVWRRRGATSQ